MPLTTDACILVLPMTSHIESHQMGCMQSSTSMTVSSPDSLACDEKIDFSSVSSVSSTILPEDQVIPLSAGWGCSFRLREWLAHLAKWLCLHSNDLCTCHKESDVSCSACLLGMSPASCICHRLSSACGFCDRGKHSHSMAALFNRITPASDEVIYKLVDESTDLFRSVNCSTDGLATLQHDLPANHMQEDAVAVFVATHAYLVHLSNSGACPITRWNVVSVYTQCLYFAQQIYLDEPCPFRDLMRILTGVSTTDAFQWEVVTQGQLLMLTLLDGCPCIRPYQWVDHFNSILLDRPLLYEHIVPPKETVVYSRVAVPLPKPRPKCLLAPVPMDTGNDVLPNASY